MRNKEIFASWVEAPQQVAHDDRAAVQWYRLGGAEQRRKPNASPAALPPMGMGEITSISVAVVGDRPDHDRLAAG